MPVFFLQLEFSLFSEDGEIKTVSYEDYYQSFGLKITPFYNLSLSGEGTYISGELRSVAAKLGYTL